MTGCRSRFTRRLATGTSAADPTESRIVWTDQWSDAMIAAGRTRDRYAKSNYYAEHQTAVRDATVTPGKAADGPPAAGLYSWLRSWWPK
jgi:hypothetical protein